jgi:hypothetical protein
MGMVKLADILDAVNPITLIKLTKFQRLDLPPSGGGGDGEPYVTGLSDRSSFWPVMWCVVI